MKNKTLHICFQDLASFMDQGLAAAKNGQKLIQDKNEIIFGNIEGFEKFLTGQKLHILSAIRIKKPDSIYSLAKMVNRDFANVSRDCAALEQKGFILLEEIGDNRGSKVPQLVFNYEVIQVHLPTNISYSHNLAA
jgi:predicted transcriptional regulator